MLNRIFLACSLLVLSAFNTSKSEVRTLSYGNITYIFHNVKDSQRRTFSGAKDACSLTGSRLVEIYDHRTNEFLRGNITNEEWYYIGGKSTDRKIVRWESGKQTSFTKWNGRDEKRPNDECIMMEHDGWSDSGCTRPQRYVCESAPMSNFRLSSTQVTMSNNSITNVTCQAAGIPVPNVRWTDIHHNDVSEDSTQSIYQEKFNGLSTLHLKNVKSKNEGKYTCMAKSNPRLVETSRNATLQLEVPSRPLFLTIDPVNCTRNIKVRWKPSQYAVETNHSILITTADGGQIFQNVTYPRSGNVQELVETLQPWYLYSVKITPCPTEPCLTKYATSSISPRITEGLPGKVENLKVAQSGADSCDISWGKPLRVPAEHILEYKIAINESTASNGSKELRVPGGTTSYTFRGNSNTTYWIAIQARTCAGHGEILWSNTSCEIPIPPTAAGIEITIGIVLGVLALLIIFVIIALTMKKRKRAAKKPSSSSIDLIEARGNGNLKMNSSAVVGGALDEPVYQNHEESPYENESAKSLVSMNDLESIYNTMVDQQSAGFVAQFEKLTMETMRYSLSRDFAANPVLKGKNRYKNILPFDLTRVSIEHSEDGYINACFIDGYQQKKKFIATQGPLKKTVNDFWQMIVEQKTYVIVMLAKCVEAGKKKCEKYWPDVGETAVFGGVTIFNLDETRFCGFVCRTLKISIKNDGREWLVSQYHFLKWPDHGFPVTTTHIMQMQRQVDETYEKGKVKSPIVVHCSAGAGRTGTWIGYDILLEESKSTGNADIYGCVAKMRRQRMEMVQNCNQFALVHKLLLESHVFGDTDIASREVPEKFSDNDFKSNTVAQFQNLSRIKPMDMLTTKQVTSAYDRMRITFNEPDTFIEASYVEAYDECSQVIVAHAPNAATVEAFREIIMEKCVGVIVMITENKEDPYKYWDQKGVIIVDEDNAEKYAIRKLRLNSQENVITQIHLHVNSKEEPRQTAIQINDSISRMLIELRESNGVALIHCKDGIGMSGVFCAVVNLLERLKVEDHLDVFRAVKDLRDCKAGMIPTTKYYELCYEAVLAYLQDFETYSNFK